MLWRRSVFFVVAVAAIFVTIAAIALLRMTTLAHVDAAQQAAIAAAVDTDLVGLADIYASGGREELVRRLSDRHALDRGEFEQLTAYRLEDSSGKTVAGALPHATGAARSQGAPVELDGVPGWQRVTSLSAGLNLAVARADPAAVALRAGLDRNFLLIGMAIIATVGCLTMLAALRLRRRIARISESIARQSMIETSGDEIDILAARSAQLVARERRLTDAYRATADTVAHEIRTPLSHLDVRLRQFASAPSDAARQDLALAARNDVRLIVAMLESLLDIAASEAHAGETAGLATIDLSALVDELVEIYRASFDEAGLDIMARIVPGVAVLGDAAQLRRLVSNLFDNAVRYVPAGGKVVVALAAGPRLRVSDDGPGIPEAVRVRLFERFSSGSGGHGLGLALVRAIAQRHGWRVTVQTGSNGTMFEVGEHL